MISFIKKILFCKRNYLLKKYKDDFRKNTLLEIENKIAKEEKKTNEMDDKLRRKIDELKKKTNFKLLL